MLKVLSLFSGIGAFEKALENIDEPFELINYCEIDKYASKAFSLIHAVNEGLNLGDITAIDTAALPNDIDVITYGFPCQDISTAGKQKGFTDENGDLTRSGLFFEALRIIEDTQPKFAIAENVKALTGKKFTAEFKIVLDSLNDAGYKNYWAVLNAKDYGIPQNRERVFIISIRNDINHGFDFPKPYELKLRLKDLLETDVDEKYYLPDELLKGLVVDISKNVVCNLYENGYKGFNRKTGETYNPDGICNTISTSQGGNRQPKILVREATKKGYSEAHNGDFVNLQFPNSKTRRGRVGKGIAHTLLCSDENGVAIEWPCMNKAGHKIATEGDGIVTSRPHQARSTVMPQCSFAIRAQNAGDSGVCVRDNGRLRIRKLTPKECFRLMGFDDKNIDILIANSISNTQLYKMAGNSIVVDVLEEIYVELLNQYSEVV